MFSEEHVKPMKKPLVILILLLLIVSCPFIVACHRNNESPLPANSAKHAKLKATPNGEQLHTVEQKPILTTWFGEGDCRISDVIKAGKDGWMITCISTVPRQYHYGKLFRIDPRGKIVWTRTFSARDLEIGSLIATADGKYILAGSDSPTAGDRLLFKEEPIGVAEDPQTGEKITYSQHISADIWMSKVDSRGNEIWKNTFDTDTDDFICSVHEDKNGDLLFAGTTFGRDQRAGFLLMKTNSAGEPVWRKKYAPFDGRLCDTAVATSEGNIMIGGTVNATRPDSARIVLLKVDNDGRELWSRIYDGKEPEFLFTLIKTAQEDWILAGRVTDEHGSYAFLRKLDPSGKEIWTRRINVDVLGDVAETEDGEIFTTGGGKIFVFSQDGDLLRQIKPAGFKMDGPCKLLVLDRSHILLVGSAFDADSPLRTGSGAQGFLTILKQ
jgi:hypothetical protein